MTRKVSTKGKPDELVWLHIRLPQWLKKRAADRAKANAQDLTSFVRSLLVASLGDRDGEVAQQLGKLPSDSGQKG